MLGTCAGAILLIARRALDVSTSVARNAYGTQLDSFVCTAEVDDPGSELAGLECVLIRAPRITRVGPGVRVHARVKGDPALVSAGPHLGRDLPPRADGRSARLPRLAQKRGLVSLTSDAAQAAAKRLSTSAASFCCARRLSASP